MTAHVDTSLLQAGSETTEERRVRLPLVGQYLNLQQDLTAVERFSRRHDANELPPEARVYNELIPLAKPRPGEQYAFSVDLDACTGCKACVTACHRLNGLDSNEAETWRSVGLLHGGTPDAPVQQTVTTACHHCVDPACMKGCPVNAYEKDPVTGIVRHLDDQCIGCQYCTLTCPYEVPQFSKKRGIVRKCDMCSSRLSAGEAPACVQACPNEAISIRIVETSRVIEDAQGDTFLPGAPSPGITVPTTTYRTQRVMPKNLLPADFHRVRPGHQHLPLVVMLVLTQLSVGAFAVDFLLGRLAPFNWFVESRPYHALVALVVGLLALAASTLHLGRPQYAFRVIAGLRTSWLSREAVAFGLFAASAMLYAALHWHRPVFARLGIPALPAATLESATGSLGSAVLASGILGVFCSVMLYKVTGRRWWSGARTTLRFFLTTGLLGTATSLSTLLVVATFASSAIVTQAPARTLFYTLATFAVAKLVTDGSVLLHLKDRQLTELRRTAILLKGPLRSYSAWRSGLGIVGGVMLPLIAAAQSAPGVGSPLGLASVSVACLLMLLAAEFLERALFFKALSAPKMPGAIGP